MSDDEKRRQLKSSQRPIAPPELPEGNLRAFKVVMYGLYLDAGRPPLNDIVDEVKYLARNLAMLLFPVGEDGESEVDAVLRRPTAGRDMIGAIIGGGSLPGTEDDSVAVAVALANVAGRLSEGARTQELAPLVRQVRDLWKAAQIPPPVTWGGQPLVSESPDLDARVLRAAVPIPYIHRDKEDEVRAHLAAGRPVLLIGPSMVGKTRLAVELIRELYADRRLFLPDSNTALTALMTESPPVTGCLVFLDDLDEVISAPGLSQQAFRRLIEANVVIATMRGRRFDDYQPTDALRPPEWNLLGEFERVFLVRELSDEEEYLVMRAVKDPEIGERIRETGIGEYVGAADRVIDALQLAPSTSPLASAMILGCADWARAGASAPVPVRLLRDLAAPHLSARQRARIIDKDYADALVWATRDINPTVSLLQPELGERYSVFTFALDLIADRGEPIPDSTWPIVVDNAETDDLIKIAREAERNDRTEVAEQALRLCEQRGEPDTAPLAANLLGMILRERGDHAGAKHSYHRAIASDHADAKPAALINIAAALHAEGADGEAEQALRQAILSDHAALWPQAALELGVLLTVSGDLDRAEETFQHLIDHPLNLERTREKLFQRAAEHGADVIVKIIDARARKAPPEVFLKAELGLADVLVKRGDLERARRVYRGLEQVETEEIREVALRQLGTLLLIEGKDLAGAQSCFERALPLLAQVWRRGHPATGKIEAQLHFNLAMVHYKRGDLVAAEARCVEAMEMGIPEVGVSAAFYLAIFRGWRGDIEGAREAAKRVQEYGSHEDAAPALRQLSEGFGLPELAPPSDG